MDPARDGTVKWPDVVPSPLSCRVSRVRPSARLVDLEEGHLVLVDHCGVGLDRLQSAARSRALPSRVERPGLLDQRPLDRADLLTRQPGRQPPGRLGDHPGVLGRDQARGQRLGGLRQPLVEVLRQARLPGCVALVGAGLLGHPRARGGEAGRRGHVGAVRRGDQLELQRLEPGPRAGALGDEGGVRTGGQLRDLHPPVERLVDQRHDHLDLAGRRVDIEGGRGGHGTTVSNTGSNDPGCGRKVAWLGWVTMNDDYCELCDLPKSQCVHGMPPPPPAPVKPKPASRPRKATTKQTPPTTTRSAATLRWTPPEVFKPAIVSVLQEAGGALEADQLFEGLEAVVRDDLKPADLERTPEGELRWRYAARRARVALIDEGLMTKDRPGVWQLADG
jgi:hypothetical protein